MVDIICAECGRVITTVTNDEYESLMNSHRYTTRCVEANGVSVIINSQQDCFCENCQQSFVECENCGCLIDPEVDVYEHFDGEYYCEDCRDNCLSFCEHCQEYCPEGSVRPVVIDDNGNTELWCERCIDGDAWMCDECNNYVSEDVQAEECWDGDTVCSRCGERHYYTCEDCGRLVSSRNRHIVGDETYCPNCVDRHVTSSRQQRDPDVIYSYHGYPSTWHFRNSHCSHSDLMLLGPVRGKFLHLGIELEIDCGGTSNRNAMEITTALGYPANESSEFKCSRDGSLDDGFEIISMPATYDWHLREYKWEAGMKRATELGYRSHDANTCGLHFHMDREYFRGSMTNPEEAFIILATNNMDWLKQFSRRTRYNYCNFYNADKFNVDSFKGEFAGATQNTLDFLRRHYRGHNAALNFANGGTVELRFIRGTLNYHTFVASLQLMEMLAYAVKHFRKEQLANVNLQWFKRFAEKRSYVEFKEYLATRGILV